MAVTIKRGDECPLAVRVELDGQAVDISEVETEYAVVAEIYDTYKVLLENGMVNPEEGLTKMLREMREAGIEDILTVERQQFAHWRERNIKVFPS